MTYASVTRRRVDPIVQQYHARVQTVKDDGHFAVVCPAGLLWLRTAASCLLVPQSGDTVLVSAVDGEDGYILAVLERGAMTPAVLEVSGDCRLSVRAGCLTLAAQRGIAIETTDQFRVEAALAHMTFGELKVTGIRLHSVWQEKGEVVERLLSVAGHAEERRGDVVRRISGHEDVSAGSQRLRFVHDWTVNAESVFACASHLFTVDAAQIQLG